MRGHRVTRTMRLGRTSRRIVDMISGRHAAEEDKHFRYPQEVSRDRRKSATLSGVATNPLARMGFLPIELSLLRKTISLSVHREDGWVYYVPWAGGRIVRAAFDPKQLVRGPDAPGEVVATFDDTIDRERFAVIVDADGDVATVKRRLGATYAMDSWCRIYVRSGSDAFGPELPLEEEEVATVLQHLNDISPDTFDEAGLGNWEFTGIEQTAKAWIVAFDVRGESDFVSFSCKHHFVEADGQPTEKWVSALSRAIAKWTESFHG